LISVKEIYVTFFSSEESKLTKQARPKAVRIAVGPVRERRAERGEEALPELGSLGPRTRLGELALQPRLRAVDAAALHAELVRQDAEAEVADPAARRHHLPGVQAQPKAARGLLERRRMVMEARRVVVEEQQVIHVTEVGPDPEAVLRPMIDGREVTVGEMLAREVPDGQPDAAGVRREEVVAREVKPRGLEPLDARRHDRGAHLERPRAGNVPRELSEEEGVVDAREVLPDVEVRGEAVGARPALRAAEGGVRPEPDAARVGISDEAAIEHGPDRLAQRLLHDPVAKRRRRDGARLRIANDVNIGAPGSPRPRRELGVQSEHHRLAIEERARDRRLALLAARGALRRVP